LMIGVSRGCRNHLSIKKIWNPRINLSHAKQRGQWP
jgi:hypothetical protein